MKKITTRLAKSTIPILQGMHLLYLRQKRSKWNPQVSGEKIAVLSMVLLIWGGWHYICHSVLTKEKFFVSSEQLHLQNLPPSWQAFVTEVLPLGLEPNLWIFAPDLTKRVALAYEKNPWVNKTLQVSKFYPNRLQVQLLLRKPIAYVKLKDHYYLTDKQGVRLPTTFTNKQSLPPLLIIEVQDVTLPSPGETWSHPDLLATLKLVPRIYQSEICQTLPVARLYFRENRQTTELVWETVHQTQIIWGACRNHWPRVSMGKRLQLLQKLLNQPKFSQQHPGLKGLKELDIRYGYAIIRK